MKLLDATVAIDHLRGVEDAVKLLRSLMDGGEILAASEVVLDAELLTTNVRDYPMLVGLSPAY